MLSAEYDHEDINVATPNLYNGEPPKKNDNFIPSAV